MEVNIKKSFYVFLIWIISNGFLFSQSERLRKDGNWWRELNNDNKLFFVSGLLSGATAYNLTLNGKMEKKCDSTANAIVNLYFWDISVGQILDGLDKFYEDYRNRLIGVDMATKIVVKEIAGEPTKDWEIDIWRKYFKNNIDKGN